MSSKDGRHAQNLIGLASFFLTFQMHLRTDCQFEELPCPRADCKEKILRKDLPDHVEKTCKYRETTCKYCKSQVPMIMLQVQYFFLYIYEDSLH